MVMNDVGKMHHVDEVIYVTYFFKEDESDIDGNKDFLSEKEIAEIKSWASRIRGMFRDEILEGNSILLEWSYAVNTNANKEKLSDPYLVFYEARTV